MADFGEPSTWGETVSEFLATQAIPTGPKAKPLDEVELYRKARIKALLDNLEPGWIEEDSMNWLRKNVTEEKGRTSFSQGSAGGYATSALQTKLTSAARNNVDNFVKTWVKNNIDNFKATQSDDFLKAMTNALKEDATNFPDKYDTGNFQFDVITKDNLPNVSTFKKGKGFKLFDVGYSVSNTNRIPAMFNKLFFKGKLATDKNLAQDVNNFMEFIVKHKTYGEGGPMAVAKRNAKNLAEVSKPEVMSIMKGLGSKAKREVLESVNPSVYAQFQKKVLGQLQNYKEDLKSLEKIVGQTEGTAWSKMTKDRKAVEKAIGIGGDFAPSVEHMFGVSPLLNRVKILKLFNLL